MEGEFSQFCVGILIGLNPNLKLFVNLRKGRSSAKESDKNCKDQHNFCSHTVWRARAPYYKTVPVLLTTRFQGKRAPHWKKHVLFLISPFSYLCFLTIPWLGLHPKLCHLQGGQGRTVGELQDTSVLLPRQEMGRGRGWGAAGQQDVRRKVLLLELVKCSEGTIFETRSSSEWQTTALNAFSMAS